MIVLSWMAMRPIPTGLLMILPRLLRVGLPDIILWRPLLRGLLLWGCLGELLRGTTRHFTVTSMPRSTTLRVPCCGATDSTTDSTASCWTTEIHTGWFRRDSPLVALLL